jgi:tripartite-type tricarboxylate transporter receptor subunit TctC
MASWVKGLGRPATYGSWGIGSGGHLYGLMFEKTLGGLYNHVPYRGDVPALQDVANGTLDITWASPTSAKPQIAAGRESARRGSSARPRCRSSNLCRATGRGFDSTCSSAYRRRAPVTSWVACSG